MYRPFGKRAFDAAIALFGLVLFMVPMLIIAVLIRSTAGRPVLFRQWRVGKEGKLFRIAKYRTMTVRSTNDSPITIDGDARVTPIGRHLRQWKLDELPQLWNVLLGDMSLVGPRPDVPGYADKLDGEFRKLLSVRPGITGPATLAFRDEELLLSRVRDPIAFNNQIIYPKKIDLNLQYVNSISFTQDLVLILRTITGVLNQEGTDEEHILHDM